jgi:hypothetical protein
MSLARHDADISAEVLKERRRTHGGVLLRTTGSLLVVARLVREDPMLCHR